MEHHAVMDRVRHLSENGRIDWIPIANDAQGQLDTSFIEETEAGDVVVMMAHNNELGTAYPIDQMAQWALDKDLVLICDAVQTACWQPIDLQTWKGVQGLALSAHKFNGPKGTGVLLAVHPSASAGISRRCPGAFTQARDRERHWDIRPSEGVEGTSGRS